MDITRRPPSWGRRRLRRRLTRNVFRNNCSTCNRGALAASCGPAASAVTREADEAVASILAEAVRAFEPAHPEKTLPLLVKARPLMAAIADPIAKIKLGDLDETIALCAGLWAEAQARQPEISPGAAAAITTTLVNRSHIALSFEGAVMEGMW